MVKETQTTKVTVRLPERIVAALRDVAEADRRSLTTTVLIAAEEYIQRKRLEQPA